MTCIVRSSLFVLLLLLFVYVELVLFQFMLYSVFLLLPCKMGLKMHPLVVTQPELWVYASG